MYAIKKMILQIAQQIFNRLGLSFLKHTMIAIICQARTANHKIVNNASMVINNNKIKTKLNYMDFLGYLHSYSPYPFNK